MVKKKKFSKVVKSRDGWKGKAKKRGSRVRNLRKTVKGQKKKAADKEEEISRLQSEIAKLQAELEARGLPAKNEAVIDRWAPLKIRHTGEGRCPVD